MSPDRYAELDPLLQLLGAELVASRKVTDQDWLPRSRQVGLTGHGVAPRLYVALGVRGAVNHLVGVVAAGTVLAVNQDPAAPVFAMVDVGIVADVGEVVPALTRALATLRERHSPGVAAGAGPAPAGGPGAG